MAHYIDKDALVAEIERTQKSLNIDDYGGRSVMAWSEGFKNFIDTLEVKEAGYRPIDNDFERDAVNFCLDNGLNTTPRIAKTIAKHFFELGLKAQKGE